MNIYALFLSAALLYEPEPPAIISGNITDAGPDQRWVEYEHHCPDLIAGGGDPAVWGEFVFSSEPGQRYTIESSATLGGMTWRSAGLPILATETITAWAGGFPFSSQRFFRVHKIECASPL